VHRSQSIDHVKSIDVCAIDGARAYSWSVSGRDANASAPDQVAASRGLRCSAADFPHDRLEAQRRRREDSTSGAAAVRREEVALPIKRRTSTT
jgi:hypothetical protein